MAWHHHGSDKPTSARAILHHTDQKGPNISTGSVSGTSSKWCLRPRERPHGQKITVITFLTKLSKPLYPIKFRFVIKQNEKFLLMSKLESRLYGFRECCNFMALVWNSHYDFEPFRIEFQIGNDVDIHYVNYRDVKNHWLCKDITEYVVISRQMFSEQYITLNKSNG